MEIEQQQLYLNKNIRLELKAIAKKNRISMSKLVEDLIIEALNNRRQLNTLSTDSLKTATKLARNIV